MSCFTTLSLGEEFFVLRHNTISRVQCARLFFRHILLSMQIVFYEFKSLNSLTTDSYHVTDNFFAIFMDAEYWTGTVLAWEHQHEWMYETKIGKGISNVICGTTTCLIQEGCLKMFINRQWVVMRTKTK